MLKRLSIDLLAVYLMKMRERNNPNGGELGSNTIGCIDTNSHTNESETKDEEAKREKGRKDIRITFKLLM